MTVEDLMNALKDYPGDAPVYMTRDSAAAQWETEERTLKDVRLIEPVFSVSEIRGPDGEISPMIECEDET